jgi:hypothetical protein
MVEYQIEKVHQPDLRISGILIDASTLLDDCTRLLLLIFNQDHAQYHIYSNTVNQYLESNQSVKPQSKYIQSGQRIIVSASTRLPSVDIVKCFKINV